MSLYKELLLLLGLALGVQQCCGQQGTVPDNVNTDGHKPCGFQKECVPRHLCVEGKIVKNGGPFIDVKSLDGFCPFLKVCCTLNNEIEGMETSTVLMETSTATSNMEPQPNKGCGYEKECVPRFLCADGSITPTRRLKIDIKSLNEDCPYLETCCDLANKRNKSLVDPTPPVAREGCGYRNSQGVAIHITGNSDSEAEFAEFPWMMAILRAEDEGDVYKCGGALIAPDVVTTAAHCVEKYLPDHRLLVRAGEWDTQTTSEVLPHQDRRVREVIVHEKYDNGALWNDIALLFLETPVKIAENVRPICLPPAGISFDFLRCYATGWGSDQFGQDSKYQVILKKLELPIVPHAQCQTDLRKTRLGEFFELDKSFICAIGENGKDTCKGDGGSPLVCPILGRVEQYYHAGIVAWGIGCGDNVPGVYGSIAHLRPWIDQQLAAKRIDSAHYTP